MNYNKELDDAVQSEFALNTIEFNILKAESGTISNQEYLTFISEVTVQPEQTTEELAKALVMQMVDMLKANQPEGSNALFIFETQESLVAPIVADEFLNSHVTVFETKELELNPPEHSAKLVIRGHFDLRYRLPEKVVSIVDGVSVNLDQRYYSNYE